MVHGSLFSGFDAPSVAASWMGWENAFHCEINDFCNTILKYWFPNSEHYEDITKTDFSQWRGRIDILTGGFPCQPFSVSGQRKGADDNRYLWPHMLRAIREIRPTWVIGENVAGILTMVQPGKETEMGIQTSLFGEDNRKRILLQQEYVVETICKDLEREGYSVQPLLIPACSVGAPHRRDRVWFIAHRNDATYPNGYGHLSCQTGKGIEGFRRRNISQQEKWGDTSERVNGFYGLSRDVADPQCSGSGQIHKEMQSEKPNGNSIDSNGSKRNVADSYKFNGDLSGFHSGKISQFEASRLRIDPNAYFELPLQRMLQGEKGRYKQKIRTESLHSHSNWQNFPTQSPVCRGNDGLPFNVDDLTIPFTKWRQESVKGYGNAIVPQVILEIFKAIEEVEQLE
ncbi:DNA (cytosine-5-)-methyltransferase [Bacteroides sp. HPS0048]|uniref:DNA cytosine methyltransferase n=1 Tax=Bacteroides sp. HPS0048 TaxID=1078089 RepID=UPI00037366B6|nr:DNA cytosine methyltransferase [Bacteroides sp. HPS0048]EOA57307.1 DNA (cytosine-5-)-methyltransferase [Bacteroides sp. HPS0048]